MFVTRVHGIKSWKQKNYPVVGKKTEIWYFEINSSHCFVEVIIVKVNSFFPPIPSLFLSAELECRLCRLNSRARGPNLCDSLPLCVVVQSLTLVWLFVTPWTVAHQASLPFTISWSLLKFMSIELVMLSNHLILCCPLLLLPSIFPSIRVFSNELTLHQVAKLFSISVHYALFHMTCLLRDFY